MRRILATTTAALMLTASYAAGAAETSFTIAVIPDTQNYVDYTHQKSAGFPFDAKALFIDQLSYVASHLKSAGGDIAFVSVLGDCWQHQSLAIDPEHEARGFKRAPNPIMDRFFAPTAKVREVEMPSVREGYQQLAGKTPLSVVPGNHDYDAMWTDSNHPAKAEFKSMADIGMLHSGGLSNFVSVFGADTDFFRGQKWYVDSHDNGADSAQIFSAGGYRFLHIGLQFDAPEASLDWAASVIKRYPGLPTIVSTHDFLDTSGERLPNPIIDNHAVDPRDNSPQMMWDKFISANDQIFLVLCGHEHAQAFRDDPNKAGHRVYQILSDYQDRQQSALDAGAKPGAGEMNSVGDGWMRLMTFDMAGKVPSIHVHTYSTFYKKESVDTADYANWYKPSEKPKLSDADYRAQDDFRIDLVDFRDRFGAGSK